MDDRETYLLNGLLARHFSLGRIVRFRPVTRGRQGEAYELFTAQEKEYLALVLPGAYEEAALNASARAVNALDTERFSVVPFLEVKTGGFVAEGPQNSRLMVSVAPEGSAMAAEQYTEHDISQVGLRLAWMHRLFDEQLPKAMSEARESTGAPDSASLRVWEKLETLSRLDVRTGWAHGGIDASSLLHDSDHQLRTVVDWAGLHFGSPLEDVVGAFAFLADAEGGRGRVLLEAYATLLPIRGVDWLGAIGRWGCHLLERARRNPVPAVFAEVLAHPEALAEKMQRSL